MSQFIITESDQPRLDVFITEKLPAHSRSQWQKTITTGDVLVNNKPTKPNYPLQAGDVVEVTQEPEKTTITLPEVKIEIIAETPDYLIINKPTGIPVHPDELYTENTLIQQIKKQFPEIQNIDPESPRPGIVHRLDKDVTGVMVVARTMEMMRHLKKQFAERSVYKEYLALVHDAMTKQEGTVELNMERDKKTGKMVTRPVNQPGKKSITEYKVLENFTHFSYTQLIIKTGRTHQIRVHMRTLDHPIVGDTLYGKKKNKANLAIDRPFLHAHKLGFTDLDNTWREFESPLPEDLQIILNSLRS